MSPAALPGSPRRRSTSRFLAVAVVAMCLPLPLVFGCALLSNALQQSSRAMSDLFAVVFFFSYPPVLLPAMYLVEPLAAILTIVYTVRASRDGGSGGVLLVCWFALAVHTLVLVWLLTHQSVPRS